jgi:Tfp pilus assembly protein PilF
MRKDHQKSRAPWVIGSALAVITLVVFFQVRAFDFIIYDDHAYVTANPQVQSGLSLRNLVWAFSTTQASNWHPLTWLSLMLDCHLFGANPGRLHLTNLLLHTASTVLLFIVLIKMTRAIWPSAFTAAAFALHPLHIQSVAWIAERKDVLSTLFWILTLLFYLRYTVRPSIARYVITLLAFALGLMAKPMLVSLPLVLLLLDYWPLGRFLNPKHSLLKLLLEKIPFLFLAAVSSVITFVVQMQSGAVKDIVKFPFTIRVINAFVSYVQYIVKMFCPANLSIFYPHPGRLLHLSDAVVPVLLLIAITVLAIRFARTHGYMFVGWLWYVVTLVPVIGIVQVGNQAMADRYTYIPLIGLFIIIAWGLPELLGRYAFRKTILVVAAAVVILAMTVSACLQLHYWQNSITIFERAVEINPGDRFAQANLGVAFLRKNIFDEAIAHFNKALEIDPCDAMSHLDIGVALYRKDKIDQAAFHFEKALQIDPCDVEAHLNLGTAYIQQGKTRQAIEQYTEAIRIDPCCTEAFNLRQQLLEQQQRQ